MMNHIYLGCVITLVSKFIFQLIRWKNEIFQWKKSKGKDTSLTMYLKFGTPSALCMSLLVCIAFAFSSFLPLSSFSELLMHKQQYLKAKKCIMSMLRLYFVPRMYMHQITPLWRIYSCNLKWWKAAFICLLIILLFQI